MEYLKKEYCCFSRDDTFMVPECMRGASKFADGERYLSVIVEEQSIKLSTRFSPARAECLVLADRNGRIEITKGLRRLAGIKDDNFTAYLIDAHTMILTPPTFLQRIRLTLRKTMRIS